MYLVLGYILCKIQKNMNMVPILLLTILCEVKCSYMKPRTNEILKYNTDSKDEVRNHCQVQAKCRNPVARLFRFKPSSTTYQLCGLILILPLPQFLHPSNRDNNVNY